MSTGNAGGSLVWYPPGIRRYIPLLLRRGGCGINKKSRSHRIAADGVVAHTQMFQNAFRNVTRERPPLLCKEGNMPPEFIHSFYTVATETGLVSIFLLHATRPLAGHERTCDGIYTSKISH